MRACYCLPVTEPRVVDQDAEHLRLLTIGHYVLAGMAAFFGSFPLIHVVVGLVLSGVGIFAPGSGDDRAPLMAVGVFFTLIGGTFVLVGWSIAVALLFSARSLAHRKRYVFCVVVSGLVAAFCIPMGTVVGVFTIVVLQRPSVKALFQQAA